MATVSALDIKNLQKKLRKELCKLTDNRVYGMNCKANRYKYGQYAAALHLLDCPENLDQETVDCIVSNFRSPNFNEDLSAGAQTAALLAGSDAPVLKKPQIKSRTITIGRDANGLISTIDYGTVEKTITRDADLNLISMKVRTS